MAEDSTERSGSTPTNAPADAAPELFDSHAGDGEGTDANATPYARAGGGRT